MIKVLNKKHAPRELLSFKNFIDKEKCGYSLNESVKEALSRSLFFLIKFKKWKIYFGPLVLAALK